MTKGGEVAAFVIQHRGYLVLGFIAPLPLHSSVSTFANLRLNQPIVTLSVTSRDDWMEQARLVAGRFREKDLYPDYSAQGPATGGYYCRANTD
jgi:hypothetical protein